VCLGGVGGLRGTGGGGVRGREAGGNARTDEANGDDELTKTSPSPIDCKCRDRSALGQLSA
jgi:hypothetical protein